MSARNAIDIIWCEIFYTHSVFFSTFFFCDKFSSISDVYEFVCLCLLFSHAQPAHVFTWQLGQTSQKKNYYSYFIIIA